MGIFATCLFPSKDMGYLGPPLHKPQKSMQNYPVGIGINPFMPDNILHPCVLSRTQYAGCEILSKFICKV